MKKTFFNISLVSIGFILSPLTWWNDMVVNAPLAYLISAPFSMLDEKLFMPSFVAAYWLTNLVGLLMIHWGGHGLIKKRIAIPSIKQSLVISIVYSCIIFLVVKLGWLASPSSYLEHIK